MHNFVYISCFVSPHSHHLPRTQSSELMNKEILPSILTRRTPSIVHNSVKSNAAAGGSSAKRAMVKQLSTTSQQSTSSAASSVQSAPEALGSKSQSPGRSGLQPDKTALALLHSWYGNHPPANAAGGCVPLELGLRHIQTAAHALLSEEEAASRCHERSKHNSETQLHTMHMSSEKLSNSNGAGTTTHKKRRRGLRFSFGSKKSAKHQDNVNRCQEKT